MIESVISRKQGVVSSGAVTSTLESGILTLAIQSWLNTYSKGGDSERVANFTAYADSIVTSISSSFKDPTTAAKMPLDRLTIGQAILDINATQGALTTAEAETLSTLNASLVLQNRNQFNGFWYYVYPYWSYLDGTVSFLPYMAAASGWSYEDMLLQIELLYISTYDNTTALVVHGYDASKTAVWANKVTGASPYVWGRSLGWYLAGLVNAWEKLGGCHGGSDAACVRLASAIQLQAAQLCKSIATYADADTGAWWQLPTLGGKQGNFLESSSTMLYAFAILKGLRLGLLKDDTTSAHGLQTTAMRAYNYTVTSGAFLLDYGNGTLGWNGTVTVCSLNSTATYEYYVGRPIVHNHALGEGAFILASLESASGQSIERATSFNLLALRAHLPPSAFLVGVKPAIHLSVEDDEQVQTCLYCANLKVLRDLLPPKRCNYCRKWRCQFCTLKFPLLGVRKGLPKALKGNSRICVQCFGKIWQENEAAAPDTPRRLRGDSHCTAQVPLPLPEDQERRRESRGVSFVDQGSMIGSGGRRGSMFDSESMLGSSRRSSLKGASSRRDSMFDSERRESMMVDRRIDVPTLHPGGLSYRTASFLGLVPSDGPSGTSITNDPRDRSVWDLNEANFEVIETYDASDISKDAEVSVCVNTQKPFLADIGGALPVKLLYNGTMDSMEKMTKVFQQAKTLFRR
ncbi:hypothetical protein BBO99_00007693 [Phytophthora kernoviae]|uniref:Uncharacterized protein n=2 Tax=Phytophthora kernoviae TaxID=325452 RepID=A0A3R7KGJ9_9STRA|nr:hypothetical protein G195_008302 [Phytophthora kernoviae 00238/432]RLN46577.1 hypothetical protein BBI17_007610 [Phytophthora kernoviae]RLN76273.1 hypothetical protein BBO99_00007693 [Phytophthora kernoviae]